VAELELDISPPPTEEGLEQVVQELRALGHEPSFVPGRVEFDQFQPLDLVIRLAEMLGAEAVSAIVDVTVRWIRRVARGRRGRRSDTVKIYGPNGEVLREVEVQPDDA
jgi:hypothetical protein